MQKVDCQYLFGRVVAFMCLYTYFNGYLGGFIERVPSRLFKKSSSLSGLRAQAS